jgi:cell division protein FtsZ
VIISIIGGEDMKLLEIDEAANHIRELVDPEANIIWGSAFNSDLEGKIRVSVVATGIEQSADHVTQASQPLNLGTARGPKKPVLPLPTEEELAEDAAAAEQAASLEMPGRDEWGSDAEEDLEESESEFGEDEVEANEAEEPTTEPPRIPEPYGVGDEGEDEEDEEEDEDEGDLADADGGFASLTGTRIIRDPEHTAAAADNGWDMGEPPEEGDEGEELELTIEAAEEAEDETGGSEAGGAQDELLLDADRLAEADQPVQPTGSRRARMLGAAGGEAPQGEAQAAPAKPAGSTLFERMANLSRAASENPSEDEDEEDEGGSSLRIPRFLGRQNNQ